MRSPIDKCIVLIAIFVFTRSLSLSLSLSLVLTHKVCFLWCGLLPNSKEWRSRLIVYPITGLVSPFFFYLYHSRQFQFPHIFASNGKNKTQTNRKNISSVHSLYTWCNIVFRIGHVFYSSFSFSFSLSLCVSYRLIVFLLTFNLSTPWQRQR